MQSKQEILDRIKADPEGTLRDLETLKSQLIADRLILKGKESLICYFSSVAEEYWRKYHQTRKVLIRARILVKQLKNAAQNAQEGRDGDLSGD